MLSGKAGGSDGRRNPWRDVQRILFVFIICGFFLPRVFMAKAQTTGRNYGLVQPSSKPVLKYLNPYFRHSSLSFVGNQNTLWNLAPSVDWSRRNDVDIVGSAKDQGNCGSCWAFSAVGALESAYALSFNVAKPDISSQQLVDCEGSGSVSNCNGGLPSDAFEYIAMLTNSKKGGLVSSAQYPYVGLTQTNQKCSTNSKGSYGITMYELTDFSGWFGYFLALQAQPIVVLIQADYSSFVNFQGAGIYDDPGCYSNIVNHAVLMTGYDLTSNPPSWIIRNSWGTSWGNQGFMKIAIRGGDGVCGIQSNPGMYPVVSGYAPCSGRINPCGGGTCIPSSNSYVCACLSGFKSVKSKDGSATCTPIQACPFFTFNPCNYGTCVDDMEGGYSCICPLGLVEGQRYDGRPTCVPSNQPSRTYKAKKGASCAMILAQFGITEANFKLKNKGLGCKDLKNGLSLNVAPDVSCSLYFTSKKDYYCATVQQTFGLTQTQFANLNPSISCSAPIPKFLKVCVKGGSAINYMVPTQTYSLQPGDTCQSIMKAFGLSTDTFYSLNPGIYCDDLTPSTQLPTPGQQVFISGQVQAPSCPFGTYYVDFDDTWARIISLYFSRSVPLFRTYNNIALTISTLYVGLPLCLPP